MAPDAYFEAHNARDCAIESFNNAVGRRRVTREGMLAYLDGVVRRVSRGVSASRRRYTAQEKARVVAGARKVLAGDGGGTTYFSPTVVWDYAIDRGMLREARRLPRWGCADGGAKGCAPGSARAAAAELRGLRAGIVIGVDPSGSRHAVAVGRGMLLDSQRGGPVPLTDEELRRSLPTVYSAYELGLPAERRRAKSGGPLVRTIGGTARARTCSALVRESHGGTRRCRNWPLCAGGGLCARHAPRR